jgi:predicted membrane metal-binding protein
MKTYNKGASFEICNNHTYTHKRDIPFRMMLKIWFGNPLAAFGLFFFLFGLPFTLIFMPISSFSTPSFDKNDLVVSGVISEADPTNSYINEEQVYKYKYTFKLRDGNRYTGVGFSTGNTKRVGETIQIYYKENDPNQSKAFDLRISEFDGYIWLFTLIFPFIGLIMLFFSIRKAVRQIFILKVGNIAEGKLLYKEATNVKINKQTVYALTFEFTASDNKTYQALAKTYQYDRLEDEAFEKLVYDPENPSNAVLLDELPIGIKNFFLKLG